ncbi:DNA cytosine methyltransferase [bacterium]|nr:DNA cytosine methyltransferase [bacterium]
MLTYGSVCSGIESASVAWEPLGLKPMWFSEIEKFPSAVLDYRWPEVPNMGDMTLLPEDPTLPSVDVLVGGTPCQSFSIAGLRNGLSDDRGLLTLKFVELADALNPAVVLWENVPGVLSDRTNAFGNFLGALVGEEDALQPPGGRWTHSGCVFGPKRTLAWRVLDAQHFGLAQRRNRVFVVACPTDGADPTKILFEREGVRRDSPPSRETRQEAPGDAGSRSAGGDGSWYVSSDAEPQVTDNVALVQSTTKVGAIYVNDDPSIKVSEELALRQRASQAGKGTRVAVGSHWDEQNAPHPSLTQSHNNGGIAMSNQEIFSQRGAGLVPTLREGNNGGAVNPVVAFGGGASEPQSVATTMNAHGTRLDFESETFAVHGGPTVRRLTPVEVARLQGFPDRHCQIPWRGKPASECPDGPQYKAFGNSMAVNVMAWIGRRIKDNLDGH